MPGHMSLVVLPLIGCAAVLEEMLKCVKRSIATRFGTYMRFYPEWVNLLESGHQKPDEYDQENTRARWPSCPLLPFHH